jgi:hypothetical protein
MTVNKSQTRDGISMAGVRTGPSSNFNVVNNNITSASRNQLQPSLSFFLMVALLMVALGSLLSHLLQHDPDVEKWMDVPAALHTFVPASKNDFDRSTKQLESLQHEMEMAQKEAIIKTDIRNMVPPYDQKRITDLQYQIGIAREHYQRELDDMFQFLTTNLRSGTIPAKGYNQQRQQWVCPSPSDWRYLKLSGDLTENSMSITALSGRMHLVWPKFGKPLAAAGPAESVQDSADSQEERGAPSPLCRGDQPLGSAQGIAQKRL